MYKVTRDERGAVKAVRNPKKIKIEISGPLASGKTTISEIIQKALYDKGYSVIQFSEGTESALNDVVSVSDVTILDGVKPRLNLP